MRLASSVEGLRGVKGATATATFTYDEKGKIPLARRGCLLIIIGSGFGEASLPQNPGSGQSHEDRPTILGFRGRLQKCRKDER